MEGEPEESDEESHEEPRATVLWEKCIQQSIFVDLSEDESLHFSDLEGSLNLHLSHSESVASEASIHLGGSGELSALDDTSSECSVVSSQSDSAVEEKSGSSRLHVSAQRPNTTQEELPLNGGREDPGQNTSDEDQEDLPFDDELGSLYFNQTVLSEGNRSSDGRETVHASPDVLPQSSPRLQRTENAFSEGLVSAEHVEAPSCPSPVDIHQLLLRHFSQEELLQSGRLIEAETLPEVSLLESVEFSLAQTHKSTAKTSNHSESQTCDSEVSQSLCSAVTEEKNSDASNNSPSDQEARSEMDDATASADSNKSSEDDSAVDGRKPEKAEYVSQGSVPFVRTRSFSEIKYGQGQVHYPLPDFSKVAPKVKIPKAPSGSTRPVPQGPSVIHRTQSSPGMIDVISRVLEDSVPPSEKPYAFNHEDRQSSPALVHHLQTEYDKLLTRYAEAENLIDQMRLGTNTHACSEMILHPNADYQQDQLNDGDDHENVLEGNRLGSMASHLPPSEGLVENGGTANKASPSQAEEGPSDGERMTAELRDIISHFMQKVSEFKLSVSNVSASTGEQQMMLRSMMEAQDELERKYISKKEEHRALEMQNYMGLCRNTGTFDPDRLVEGEIFRLGMHLEDIKEMIDKNVCEHISAPLCSSSPASLKEMLRSEPVPLCGSTTARPPSMHEGPSAFFSAADCEIGKHNVVKEGDEEDAEGTRSAHADGGSEQSDQLISSDSLLERTGWNSSSSWSPTRFCARSEDEEGSSALSEGIDHSNILAYLSGSGSASSQRDWTPDSSRSSSCVTPRDSGAHCLLEPPLSASSRRVSPESDSGFGSSYLNQSGSGPFQPNHLAESGFRSSDSEGSSSNLQTAIHSVSLTSQRWTSPHVNTAPNQSTSAAAAAVECRMESSEDKTGSYSIQPAPVHHRASAPAVSTSMATAVGHSQNYRCSCNSEAILALQSEVTRLKRDLEEGLVQLPHLAQKMDYLTFKYKQVRQERRSKSRPRVHQKSAPSSPAKIEDWISSDMEPSRSKVTDSGDTAGSELTLQFYGPPAGSRGGRAEFECAAHPTLQSHRGTGTKTYGFTSFSLKRATEGASENSNRPQTAIMGSYCSKQRWSPVSSASLQKPLLQVNYGSSCSLPASYKVREPPLQSTSSPRKRSTQSDTALLPSNVYFQQTSAPLKTGSRRRWSREEDMNRTLDQAIEVARSMKRTTDRMAKRLSADLAKAHLYRKHHTSQPLGGRKHQAL